MLGPSIKILLGCLLYVCVSRYFLIHGTAEQQCVLKHPVGHAKQPISYAKQPVSYAKHWTEEQQCVLKHPVGYADI
jgi:hypothetical protein